MTFRRSWRVARDAVLAVCLLVTARGESGYRLLGPADFEGLATRVELEPGDFLLLPDAAWDNVTLRFNGHGTREKPITLRPLRPGTFVLRGKSTLRISGDWLVVEGVRFLNESGAEVTVIVDGHHNRVSSCRFEGPSSQPAITLAGAEHEVEKCSFSAPNLTAAIRSEPGGEKPAGHVLSLNVFASLSIATETAQSRPVPLDGKK